MIGLTILAIVLLTILAVARDHAATSSRPTMPLRQRLALWLWPTTGAEAERSLDLAVEALAARTAALATARLRVEELEQLLRAPAPSAGPYRTSSAPGHLSDRGLLDAYEAGATGATYNAAHLAGLRAVARAGAAAEVAPEPHRAGAPS